VRNQASPHARAGRSGTAMMQEWLAFKQRNPLAKLVCIDIQPYDSTQTPDNPDVLNVGGFSDAVFGVVSNFTKGGGATHWVDEIERTPLAAS